MDALNTTIQSGQVVDTQRWNTLNLPTTEDIQRVITQLNDLSNRVTQEAQNTTNTIRESASDNIRELRNIDDSINRTEATIREGNRDILRSNLDIRGDIQNNETAIREGTRDNMRANLDIATFLRNEIRNGNTGLRISTENILNELLNLIESVNRDTLSEITMNDFNDDFDEPEDEEPDDDEFFDALDEPDDDNVDEQNREYNEELIRYNQRQNERERQIIYEVVDRIVDTIEDATQTQLPEEEEKTIGELIIGNDFGSSDELKQQLITNLQKLKKRPTEEIDDIKEALDDEMTTVTFKEKFKRLKKETENISTNDEKIQQFETAFNFVRENIENEDIPLSEIRKNLQYIQKIMGINEKNWNGKRENIIKNKWTQERINQYQKFLNKLKSKQNDGDLNMTSDEVINLVNTVDDRLATYYKTGTVKETAQKYIRAMDSLRNTLRIERDEKKENGRIKDETFKRNYEFVIDITKGIDGEKSAKSVKVENLNFSKEPYLSVYNDLVKRYGKPKKSTTEFIAPVVPNIHTMDEIRDDVKEEAVATSNLKKGSGIRKLIRGKLR